MPPLYYAVRETDSYADVVLHADRDCVTGPMRAAPSTVDGDHCPECSDGGADDDATDEADESDTCEAELSTGGVCGRELPCQYHSD